MFFRVVKWNYLQKVMYLITDTSKNIKETLLYLLTKMYSLEEYFHFC